MIYKKVSEFKSGLMVHLTEAFIRMGKNMDLGCIFGLMEVNMWGIELIIRSLEKVSMCGWMEGIIKVSGSTIICMDLGFILGKMEGSMRGIISLIRKMEKGLIRGMTGSSIRGVGGMENSMEKGSIFM